MFNRLLDEHANKADVLCHGLHQLLTAALHPEDDIAFAIDRQGGRIYYAALLQATCPDGWINVVEESEQKCRYRTNVGRELTWSFEVAAESRHFTVALASMVSKY